MVAEEEHLPSTCDICNSTSSYCDRLVRGPDLETYSAHPGSATTWLTRLEQMGIAMRSIRGESSGAEEHWSRVRDLVVGFWSGTTGFETFRFRTYVAGHGHL
jgi:hypothetical protein